jgi:beta-glucosidase
MPLQVSPRPRRILLLGSVLALATAAPVRTEPPPQAPANAPYLDVSLPIERRVDDLVSRMTLPEKISQMRDHAPAIPRLGVPRYDWWNEGLHGVAFGGYATNFPQVIGMAATWDTGLVQQMAEVISSEARAKYHQAMREDHHEMFFGLTFWAPNVNIFRDPRWGRGQETYGEDPFLTGRMAVAFVSAMQGSDPKHLKVVSTPKHFAVHSGPEPLRHRFDVKVSPRDLEDTYLPAFRAAVTEAHAQSVMCAYNAVDGFPACASPMLLRDHLRDDWRFDGYVVSDCAAVADVAIGHRFAPDFAHASAVAVKAGTDLECQYGKGTAFSALADSIKQGLLAEANVDRALKRLFTARFRLGMFDPADSYAYGRTPLSEVNSAEHRALALRAAREAIVLLKNDNGFLPLSPDTRSIAVVGPTAELVQSLQGNYNGTPPDPVSPLAGIERRFKDAKVLYAQGSTLAGGFGVPIAHTALRTAEGKEGLTGEYFSAPDLTGKPVAVRVDRTLNFNWDKAIPVSGLQRDHFSVRWTGTFTPPAPGDYTLGALVAFCYACASHEQFRLYVDGRPVAGTGGKEKTEALLHFDSARPHPIRLDYWHGTAAAGIDLVWQPPAPALAAEAVAAAKQSDVVVALVGLSPQLEGEEMPVKLEGFAGGDRTDIRLPRVQRELLQAVKATGKPLVIVLTSGSALALPEEDGYATAILEAWYPGEEGGTAVAETLAGDNNPAGRLPLTFYASVDQLPPFEEYSMANRTYRYFAGKPLWGFGYGLSYSRFQYENLRLSSQSLGAGEPLTVEADVRNAGGRAGDEVVQLYMTQPKRALTPLRTLGGFTRVHVGAGETAHVRLQLDPRTLGQVDEKGERVVVPGKYVVTVGGGQPADFPGAVTASFDVTGSKTLPR